MVAGGENARTMVHPADPSDLRKEYYHLQEVLESFDQRALTIKAWSVTVSIGGLVAAKIDENALVYLIAGIASLLFWITEALWKVHQQCFYARLYEIERLLSTGALGASPLIAHSWHDEYGKKRGTLFWRVLFWPHVALPHAVIALAGPLVWLSISVLAA